MVNDNYTADRETYMRLKKELLKMAKGAMGTTVRQANMDAQAGKITMEAYAKIAAPIVARVEELNVVGARIMARPALVNVVLWKLTI